MVYRQEGHIIDIIWGLKIWFESLKKRGSGEINCYKAIQQFSSLISSTKTIAAIICKTCVVKASSNYKLIENINNPHRPDLLALSNVTRRIKKCEKKKNVKKCASNVDLHTDPHSFFLLGRKRFPIIHYLSTQPHDIAQLKYPAHQLTLPCQQ